MKVHMIESLKIYYDGFYTRKIHLLIILMSQKVCMIMYSLVVEK